MPHMPGHEQTYHFQWTQLLYLGMFFGVCVLRMPNKDLMEIAHVQLQPFLYGRMFVLLALLELHRCTIFHDAANFFIVKYHMDWHS